MSHLTLEELRKAEAIYTESAADWAWEHETVYRAHLEGVAEKVAAGSPAGLSNHLKLDKLYRQYAGLGATMLPAFTEALNQLEEAQRLLETARMRLSPQPKPTQEEPHEHQE